LSNPKDQPDCFGDWAVAFPLGENGLRTVAADCAGCPVVRPCLAAGAEGPDGRRMRRERRGLSSPPKPQKGVAGFLKRWSDRKMAHKAD
jgi:hypothetical protein